MTGDRRPGRVALALVVVILLIAAFLVTILTLSLLSRSIVEFAIIAGVCWVAIFAAALVTSRSLSRSVTSVGRSAGRETLAQGAERILHDPVAHDGRLEGLAGVEAHGQEGLD
jgi:cobalamin biosynthesis protein CobD/CbiB